MGGLDDPRYTHRSIFCFGVCSHLMDDRRTAPRRPLWALCAYESTCPQTRSTRAFGDGEIWQRRAVGIGGERGGIGGISDSAPIGLVQPCRSARSRDTSRDIPHAENVI